MIRFAFVACLAIAIFLGLNFGWTHAALAGLVTTKSKCPPALQTAARQRVEELFGVARASPWLVCLNEPTLGLSISHGTARFAPLLPTIIVLGPNGQNTDVAAHEFAHAEIATRTSALLRSYVVPTWFDEGLAMQLDKRADYSTSALQEHIDEGRLERTSLSDLRWPSGFFRRGAMGKANYALAKCTVGRWLEQVGKDAMKKRLAAVSWQRSFPINDLEAAARDCKGQPYQRDLSLPQAQ